MTTVTASAVVVSIVVALIVVWLIKPAAAKGKTSAPSSGIPDASNGYSLSSGPYGPPAPANSIVVDGITTVPNADELDLESAGALGFG